MLDNIAAMCAASHLLPVEMIPSVLSLVLTKLKHDRWQVLFNQNMLVSSHKVKTWQVTGRVSSHKSACIPIILISDLENHLYWVIYCLFHNPWTIFKVYSSTYGLYIYSFGLICFPKMSYLSNILAASCVLSSFHILSSCATCLVQLC